MGTELAYHARHFARFYDWEYARHTQDIPFWLELARRYGSPVLELACGTGRLSLPLARAGHRVLGLDLSAEMLRLLRAKLRQEPPEVRRRVQPIQGDMTDFIVEEPVRLAFLPFSSFFHLHTQKQRLGCLRCAYRALAPGGAFLIDLQTPRVMEQQVATDRLEEIKYEVNPDTGCPTQALHQRLVQDRKAQRTTCRHVYVEELPNGRARRYEFVQEYAWIHPEEMVRLFTRAGFRDPKVCGGYGLRPFRERSYRMIFLAEK